MSTQPPAPPQAPAPGPTQGQPSQSPQRGWGKVFSNNFVRFGLVALIVAAVVVAILVGSGGSSHKAKTLTAGGPVPGAPAAPAFNLSYPSSWSQVPASQLSAYPGKPVAVLLRKNRTGLIVITRARTNPKLGLPTLGPVLAKKISARFHDAKTVASRTIHVNAGRAFYYSFARTKAGTVHGLLVVPAGAVTYELNSVAPGDQPQAARDIGQIFRSFSLP
jgi:hypothetical protein